VDRSHNNARIAKDVRDNSMLAIVLDCSSNWRYPSVSALGLAASGSYRENGISPDRSTLLSYIKKWMAESGASRLARRQATMY